MYIPLAIVDEVTWRNTKGSAVREYLMTWTPTVNGTSMPYYGNARTWEDESSSSMFAKVIATWRRSHKEADAPICSIGRKVAGTDLPAGRLQRLRLKVPAFYPTPPRDVVNNAIGGVDNITADEDGKGTRKRRKRQ